LAALYFACIFVAAFMAAELLADEDEDRCPVCGDTNCRPLAAVVTFEGKPIPATTEETDRG
jgi:hypothetical protein